MVFTCLWRAFVGLSGRPRAENGLTVSSARQQMVDTADKQHTRANKMNIQLVPPHNHCVNTAELAIATFKENFVAALATVDMLCPLQPWDEFLPQVKLTLNLLRFPRRNPSISANQEVYGAFDFNKTPLAPLGTKALGYDDFTACTSWAPSATDGFHDVSVFQKHISGWMGLNRL